MSKVLLITGATGKQGGAVINALLSSPAKSDFTILAVTRNPSSPAAQKLASKADNIKLVQGDLDNVPAIFDSASKATSEPIWGVFSVQVPFGKGATVVTEETQGKALVDEAVKRGVKHFVYTSVDRHGDKSSNNPTNVPHFISKHNIEQHLLSKTSDGQMTWTILRPVGFFDNLAPNFVGKVFGTLWEDSMGDCPVQFISAADIGWFGAQSFIKPDEYSGKSISLAGDELTFDQANKIFKEKVGYEIPRTFSIVGWAIRAMVKDMRLMFAWFKTEGYAADIAALKQTRPELMDFGTWLEKESGFKST